MGMVGRKKSTLAVALALCIVLIPAVMAIGISHEYLEDKTMELSPGENYYFKLTIQNKENESVTVNVSLKSEIAEIIGGGTITVPPEDFDEFVYFNITVPPDAIPGTIYNMDYKVIPVGRGEGLVPFAITYSRTIKVRVAGTPPPEKKEEPIETPNDIEHVLQPTVEQPRSFMNFFLIAGLIFIFAAIVALVWQRSGQVVLAMKRRRRPKQEAQTAQVAPQPAAMQASEPSVVEQPLPETSIEAPIKAAAEPQAPAAPEPQIAPITAPTEAPKAPPTTTPTQDPQAPAAPEPQIAPITAPKPIAPITAPTEAPKTPPVTTAPIKEPQAAPATKPVTPATEMKIQPLSTNTASPDKVFNLNDGRQFRDIPGMLFSLETMNENTFQHHTGQGRNDFSAWLQHTLGQPALAAQIAALHDRASMIKVLQNALG